MAGNRTPSIAAALTTLSPLRRTVLVLAAGAVLVGAWWMWSEIDRRIEGTWQGPGDWWGKRATQLNYGEDVQEWAQAFDLPEAYLLALIQLESGGRKPAGKRFEAHVYNRLVAVRDGKRERYEQITAADLMGCLLYTSPSPRDS